MYRTTTERDDTTTNARNPFYEVLHAPNGNVVETQIFRNGVNVPLDVPRQVYVAPDGRTRYRVDSTHSA